MKKIKNNDCFNSQINNKNKKVFVFLAADYGNLGDVAITYAQTNFFKKILPNYQIVDVPISKTLEGIITVKKYIQKEDIITIVGGGNLGDLYKQIEFYRQLVVENFPKNKIISFPQTIDFSKSKKGKKALSKAKKRYSKHTNLTFVAREQESFKIMKQVFSNNKVLLTPDIVLSLNKTEPVLKRMGVVLCLRDDAEKLLTNEEQSLLLILVKQNFDTYYNYDTHIQRGKLSLKERNSELNKIWNAFKRAELVITDRLHGMIFCYITNTPCIVFKNNNHKIEGSYQWLKQSNFISLINEFSELKIEKLFNNHKRLANDLNYSDLTENYKKLIKKLKE
jgi:pyruvyl transferase EpsI